MFQLVFYVPSSYLEVVKEAIFDAGAGSIGNYDRCCWQTKGIGQFRPNKNSNPFVGEIDKVHKEEEWKVECVLEDNCLDNVIKALKGAHPYEIPAYSVIHLLN